MLKQPEVQSMVSVMGFSFSGQGQNAGLAFVPLKDWSERKGAEHSAQALAGRAFGALMGVRDAFIFALAPPSIPELGTATGFNFRLQDRGGNGHAALLAARNQMLGMAGQSKIITGVRPDGLEDAPQLQIDIDRDRAARSACRSTPSTSALTTALGSAYVNDFPNKGRLQRVVVQADAPARMQPDDLLNLNVMNVQGKLVPLSAFASTRWVAGAMQTIRYNGYPAMRLAGDAAPGYSTGEAMDEMERLAAQLPPGFAFEWTGLSREEKLSGSQTTALIAFSLLAVFLCLAALYESWTHPGGGDAGGAAGRARRDARRDDPRHAQRRVLQGRPDRGDRPVGEERDPDHRVRERPARAGQGPHRGHARGLPPALPADPDDLDRVHPRRRAAGGGHRAPARPASAPSAPA